MKLQTYLQRNDSMGELAHPIDDWYHGYMAWYFPESKQLLIDIKHIKHIPRMIELIADKDGIDVANEVYHHIRFVNLIQRKGIPPTTKYGSRKEE